MEKTENQEKPEKLEKPDKKEALFEKVKLLIPENAALKKGKESDSSQTLPIAKKSGKKSELPNEGRENNVILSSLAQAQDMQKASLKEAWAKSNDPGGLKTAASAQEGNKEAAAKLTVVDMRSIRSTGEKAETTGLKSGLVSEEKINLVKTVADKKEDSAARSAVRSAAGKNDISHGKEKIGQKIDFPVKELDGKPERAGAEKNAAPEKPTGEADSSLSLRTLHVDMAPAGESGARDPGTVMQHNTQQLASRLQSDLSSKIVKNASIVVRSESSGEIKLVLHPENMGRVRIQVQMEDNRIAGRIYVDNTSVREAFEANLKNLERAFLQEGFDSAKLDVFVGGREQSHRQKASSGAGWNGTAEERAAAESLAASVPQVDRYSFYDHSLIDLVV